jgi:hypothetical protein
MFFLGVLFDEILYEGLKHYVLPFSMRTESHKKIYNVQSKKKSLSTRSSMWHASLGESITMF